MKQKIDLPKPPDEMVAYYKAMDAFIRNQTNNLKLITMYHLEAIDQFIKGMKKDTSLLEEGCVAIDNVQVAGNFKQLVELLSNSSTDNHLAEQLRRSVEDNQWDANFWNDSIEKIEQKIITLAEEMSIDVHSLLQLAYWSMSPYWRLAAHIHKEALNNMGTNERDTCPICGKHADFALLDDNEHGRRYLVCLHCDFKWPFKRIGCSYCGNEDYQKLGYILIDNVEGYKVYHCEVCKTYLKTFDQRADVPSLSDSMMLVNVETLFLDIVATEKGYRPMR